uniref:alpha-L-fucosidase n=1 Tax=Phallusia mammillata TaxID=59560 RepID=A0A6F9DD47_9ASCI|nr:alpha-L-fucosidase [Phallusia mammillata]
MKSVISLSLLSMCIAFCNANYEPNWDSLDSRPLPTWYDEAKFGIFIHWGVFAVPSYGQGAASEWFWWNWQGVSSPAEVYFMQQNYPPDFTYGDFAKQFTAEFYDADKWAEIFQASGAKYIVLTSKHHEGYTNWPSATSWNWNSMDIGPKRDIVGELANAIRNKTSIHFGLYHSLFEWFNPSYLQDKESGFKTDKFVKEKTMPELYDIVNRYKPDVIWSDGQWEANSSYWSSPDFLAWLYNESPVKNTVVTNDRWGSDTLCKHGGYLTCSDRYNPGTLQTRKWENAMTIDKGSWGYRRNIQFDQYMTIEELLQELVTTISCNGNILVNVGPTKEGTITPVFEERLRQMGEWLGVNGEGVYSSKPWTHQNDTMTKGVWYTKNEDKIYAFSFSWPDSGVLILGAANPKPGATIDLLGGDSALKWEPLQPRGVGILLPVVNPATIKAKWVYVFRLTGFESA